MVGFEETGTVSSAGHIAGTKTNLQIMTNNIKQWQEEERPREKMMLNGCESLTVSELLAIIIRSGSRKFTAVDAARNLLAKGGGRLASLAKLTVNEMTEVEGIGATKAVSVLAALELGRRLSAEVPDIQPLVQTSSTVVQIMSPRLKALDHEECWILYLNRASRLISKERVSQGGVTSTVMDIKLIVRKAVDHLASSIIMVHNHPSGSPKPGRQDIEQTEALKKAANLFDIALLDHIIIAGNKYYSFSDENS
jgi:DNA repair protein radc